MSVHHTAYDDLDEREHRFSKACERLIIPYRGRVYAIYVSPENSEDFDKRMAPFIHAATDITDKAKGIVFPHVSNPSTDFFEVMRIDPEYPKPMPPPAAPGNSSPQGSLFGGGEAELNLPEYWWEVAKTEPYSKRQAGRRLREKMKAWAEAANIKFPQAGRINNDIVNGFAKANPSVVKAYLESQGTPNA